MSVLSRKRTAEAEAAETRGRMQQQLAWLTVLARATGPMAKTAGMTARDSVRNAAQWTAPRINQARAWTAPRINQARAWTAPRIERSGLIVRDTIAPKVCERLAAAARYVDVTEPGPDGTASRRRWPQVVGVVLAASAAAAGAAAAVVLRRRKDDRASGAPEEPAEAVTDPQAAQNSQLNANADGSGAQEADGSGAKEDVSRQSPAT
jgi:hypothetical protein